MWLWCHCDCYNKTCQSHRRRNYVIYFTDVDFIRYSSWLAAISCSLAEKWTYSISVRGQIAVTIVNTKSHDAAWRCTVVAVAVTSVMIVNNALMNTIKIRGTKARSKKIPWPPEKNSLNKKASWVRIAETSCIGPCLQSLIDINFESCASATVVSRKALYFKTAAVIISTSHQMTMTTNTSGGFRNYRRRRAEPGKEVSQRGPGAEPRWGSEVEAPRSWRHILKITIANIISRDRCINTHRVP